LANNKRIKLLDVFGDSELIILQVKGLYSTKDERLKAYREVVIGFINSFEAFSISYILRNQNDLIDALPINASSSQSLEFTTFSDIKGDVVYRPYLPNNHEH
jgi:hypothetical protein